MAKAQSDKPLAIPAFGMRNWRSNASKEDACTVSIGDGTSVPARGRSLARDTRPSGQGGIVALDDALEREKLENSYRHLLWLIVELDEMVSYCQRHRLDRMTHKTQAVIRDVSLGAVSRWLTELRDDLSQLEREMIALGFKPPLAA